MCLTEFSDPNLLQVFEADVRDKVNIFIAVLYQNLVVLAQTQVRQPVCQIGLKTQKTHTGMNEVIGSFTCLQNDFSKLSF